MTKNNTRKWLVYVHTNKINGKKYYGITSQKAETRWGKDGYRYQSSPYFYNAINKYGWDNFDHDILYTGLDEKEAKEKEKYFISKYKTNEKEFGYNQTEGGDGTVGRPFTREMNDKRGTCKQVVQLSMDGEKMNVFYNIHEASREVGCSFGHISACCNGYFGRKSVAGFRWMFLTDYEKWDRTLESYFERFDKEPKKRTDKERKKSDVMPNTTTQIYLFNTKGEFIKSFNSINSAIDELKVDGRSVRKSCDKKIIIGEKMIFSYNDSIKLEEYSYPSKYRKVNQYDLNGNYINSFLSIKEASFLTGVPSSGISSCCRGVYRTTGGFKWEYAS